MSVGEEFAESGLAVHDTVPSDELSSSLIVSGFAEESALVGTGVPFGVSFDLERTLKFDIDGVARDAGDGAGERGLLDVFGPPSGAGFLHVVVKDPAFEGRPFDAD